MARVAIIGAGSSGKYFENYVAHFKLNKHIEFNRTISNVSRHDEGWKLVFEQDDEEVFTHVIVANGHHWSPKWPQPRPPGDFAGIEAHSHHFIDPDEPNELRGKNVVVVGMGNSAMDIACELSRKGVANKVWLSCRSGVHVMPKYFGDKLLDAPLRHPTADPGWGERLLHLLPRRTRTLLFSGFLEKRIESIVGKPQAFGLPAPSGRFYQNHPTISNEIHARLGSGDLLPKPEIKRLDGASVEFADGTTETVDAIIWCTGYNISFPFLDADIIDPVDNKVALYKRIFDDRHDGLYFVGLVQPLCALMPIAQVQSRLVASHILGDYQLPTAQEMRDSVDRELSDMQRSYATSTRHTIQIDCMEYTWDLRKEVEQGKRRAAA